MLHLTDWGVPHSQCIKTDFETFKAYMADFLDRYVPGFGLVETENSVGHLAISYGRFEWLWAQV